MKFDRNGHPVCQIATKIIFACFIAYCFLAVLYFGSDHRLNRRLYCWAVPITSFLFCCALITYLRPKGFAAFVTSTAYVALFAILGVVVVAERFDPDGRWGAGFTLIVLVVWIAWGIVKAVRAYRQGIDIDASARRKSP